MGLFSVGCLKGQPPKLNRSDYRIMLNEDVRLLQFMLHPIPYSDFKERVDTGGFHISHARNRI